MAKQILTTPVSWLWYAHCHPQIFSGHALGTSYTVTVTGRRRVEDGLIHRVIERDLRRVDGLMSVYRADSDVGRLNHAAPDEWVPVAPETAFVLQQAIDIGHRSKGAYDVTVGALVGLWGFGPDRRPFAVPDAHAIVAAQSGAGLDKLDVRLDPPAARRRHPALQVDLSGIAKGFAVDLVASNLHRLGIKHYCVEVGGEICTRGRNTQGRSWQIAVETPGAEHGAFRCAFALSNRSLATSGDYRQFFEAGGRRYSHTIDPRTGRPIEHALASVTVIRRSCARADGWATALLVAGPEGGLQLAEQEGIAALFILRTAQGFQERCSSQFERIKEN